MQQVWNYLVPGDQYAVMSEGIIHPYDLKLVTSLYQPLIGVIAAGLYYTFWMEMNDDEKVVSSSSHYSLIAKMRMPLKQFFQERQKLEAIGLLKTYQKQDKEVREVIYELLPPLTPAQFFNDGVLNVFLYNQLGKHQYTKLKNQFIKPNLPNEFKEVSAAFNDVFSSVLPSELIMSQDAQKEIEIPPSQHWSDRVEGPGPTIKGYSFSFDVLFQKLSDVILPKEAFTEDVKDAIVKLAFVYQLGPEMMGQIIQRAFLHDSVIDIPKLRKEVQKHYRIEVGSDLPALTERTQPLSLREMSNKEPKNDEEKLIDAFEKISPYELLEMLAGGARPPAPDLKAIEEVLFEQKLPPGVMNVLIHYVMETNDQKLVKAYLEKLAGHWGRKKVKTVPEAMELARSEHRKYQAWTEKKRTPSQKNRSRNQREERLPKWLTEAKSAPKTPSNDELQKQEEWLENYLKDI